MKKSFLILLIIPCALMTSCSKENDNGEEIHMGVSFDIAVVDSAGNDLLDPETPNAYAIDSVKEFYSKPLHGQLKDYVFTPYMYDKKRNGYTILRIECNNNENKKYPLSYLKWNSADTDTLKTKFRRANGVSIDSVWYNGKLLIPHAFSNPGNGYNYIQVVKNP